jgi:hypothetical protein
VGVENTADEQTRQSEAVADLFEEGAGRAKSRRGDVLSDKVIHNATNDLVYIVRWLRNSGVS